MDWTGTMDHTDDIYTDLTDEEYWNVKEPSDERIMSLATILQKIMAFSTVNKQSKARCGKRTLKPINDWKFVRDGDKNEKL